MFQSLFELLILVVGFSNLTIFVFYQFNHLLLVLHQLTYLLDPIVIFVAHEDEAIIVSVRERAERMTYYGLSVKTAC